MILLRGMDANGTGVSTTTNGYSPTNPKWTQMELVYPPQQMGTLQQILNLVNTDQKPAHLASASLLSKQVFLMLLDSSL